MYPEEPVITTRVEKEDKPRGSFEPFGFLKKFSDFRGNRIIYLVGIILLIWFWVWISSPMIVTVVGVGEVNAPAANATISFNFSTNNTSVQTAVSNANAGALLMRTYLEKQGIPSSDIAESQVSVAPLATTGSTPKYQATISMAAKTADVAGVSTLISNLYANGASSVSQPILSVDDQDALDQQAFDAALSDAKSQAGAIGNKSFKIIRKIIAISQVSSPSTSTATTKDEESAASAFKIVKAVTVSYKMW